MTISDRDLRRSKEINSNKEVMITCDCGNPVKVQKGSKAFYCPGCGSSKLVSDELGFIIPSSDYKS